LSSIILGGITLPRLVDMPKLEFEPVILYSEPSVTGRLHNTYQRETVPVDFGVFTSVRFNRKFTFSIINLTFAQSELLKTIDGTNCVLTFIRERYSEEYNGNLDCNFLKFDEFIYEDAVDISFTVTSQNAVNPTQPTITYDVLLNKIIMAATIGTIYYTYSATGTPANPTILSTEYTAPISPAVGYYKAISYKYGYYSTVKSFDFGV